mmetsp:Transcript_42260/g.102123  ORF Transcript_42260/g.102123 Transcript_42260/m.102123 type:complete len:626 (+) Transcript_42260:121-1998(+)
MTTKRVAFSSPDDKFGEPSVEFHLYDYCDSQSVVSEAVSIDLSLIQKEQQQQQQRRGKNIKGIRGQEKGMGKLLKQRSRSSITSDVSMDISSNSPEMSFWDNEENSFADYVNFANQNNKGGQQQQQQQQRPSGKLAQRASITSAVSTSENSFWNNDENSFADYAQQFARPPKQDRRLSGSFHLTEEGFSEIRFDEEGSLGDSFLSMGSFALDGGVEILGFEDVKDGDEPGHNNNNNYTAASKAAMLDGSGESWSITESLLKDADGEEDLRDSTPMNMRRADRRAQRARDRLSAYSRVPGRTGSVGSISLSSVGPGPKRKDSLGKYSDHSLGSMSGIPRRNGSIGKYSDHSKSLSSGVPRRNGSLGKYSDHSSGPRRNVSLGKYSDHSQGRLSRRPSTGVRRNGSIGPLSAKGVSRNSTSIGTNSGHGIARRGSTGYNNPNSGHGIARRGSTGYNNPQRRNDDSAVKSSLSRATSIKLKQESAAAAAADVPKPDTNTDEQSPTLRQRNGIKSEIEESTPSSSLEKKKKDKKKIKESTSSSSLEKKDKKKKNKGSAAEKKNKKKDSKNIVSPVVTKEMKVKLGSSASDLSGVGPVFSPRTSKAMKIKMGRDSDHLPRSASLRQQLLG